MRHFFRRLAHTTGLLHAPSDPARSATRPLRVLLVGSILFPLTLYGVAAAVSYHQHFEEARDQLRRNLAIVHEHAQKVFETFEFASRYLDELTANVTDEQIRANEAMYSERLKALTASLPQLRDLWIVGADGYPLVSGTVYPMPRIDLSDRNYFKSHRDNPALEAYVSQTLAARAANTRFFAISRKRTVNGQFSGVTIVSIAPEYFADFYSQLPPPGSATLLRADGAVLARYPDYPGAQTQLRADAPFMTAIKTRPKSGFVTAAAAIDGGIRIFTYQQLVKLPTLYVVAGIEKAAVIREWMLAMATHLIFGIPATLALVGLGFIALRRTERLQQEITRRESTEQALRQAQKMEAVGRLSGGIAHDFNNMLTVILGNIDIASRRIGDDNPRIQRLLDSARQASERAATLVQRLLAFSRQHPQEVKSVDINRLVQSMSELLRRTIGETITVETVLAGGLWKVAVDANQLENAVLNLAVNARDAMAGGGRLTIETANSYLDEAYVSTHSDDFAAGQYVLLAVTDSGTGMSPEVRERAFEPFFTTKPTGMGTGLGLSMVYGFMKQSNGHIKIYSEAGEGTTIKLYFPRIGEQRALPDWSDERTAARPAPSPRGSETILLVEDDEEVRKFAVEILREQGYTIHAAPNAVSALQLLETESGIGMLFTDVVLPGGMNGRQLADEARRRRPELKVLYATGYTRNAIIHQGRLDAEVELLTKPFTAEALARKIRQILDGPPSAAPAGRVEGSSRVP
jgi:two-component system NtrC family sensor kinase